MIVNLGLFLYFQQRLGDKTWLPLEVWALTVFVILFTFAIAIFKDIPDAEGDRQYRIRTLTLKLGAKAVFKLALWVLTVCYLGMVAATPWLHALQPLVLVSSQLIALGLLWWRSRTVDLRQSPTIASFYQFIWKLFFLEYLMFPLSCLLD